ncbi:hypothetical protein [Actinocrispum wychmicini]|uniref:Uncharacterized protein n=1 Tax=Actinocrispum wychmicini TaxID=1213861 RepID=A0A4R2JFP1_9PSEU|nr:hypothetical protein [Actinocrispum wychmicini]TCO55678.1 hypothetical protein EV192_107100 [Actinocrispum wychmicini]
MLFADSRRELHAAVPTELQVGYTVSGHALGEAAARADASVRHRLPYADVDADRLKRRDWWTGPPLFMIVDDYELLTSGLSSALEPPLDLLPLGAEIGSQDARVADAADAVAARPHRRHLHLALFRAEQDALMVRLAADAALVRGELVALHTHDAHDRNLTVARSSHDGVIRLLTHHRHATLALAVYTAQCWAAHVDRWRDVPGHGPWFVHYRTRPRDTVNTQRTRATVRQTRATSTAARRDPAPPPPHGRDIPGSRRQDRASIQTAQIPRRQRHLPGIPAHGTDR